MKLLKELGVCFGTSIVLFYMAAHVDALISGYLRIAQHFQLSDDQAIYAHLALGVIIILILLFLMRKTYTKDDIRETILVGCCVIVELYTATIFVYTWPTLSDTARFVGIVVVAIVTILPVSVLLARKWHLIKKRD